MISRRTIEVNIPLNATSEGPRLRHANGTAEVDYDFEHDDGRHSWARLIFRGVLASRLTDSSCCTADQIGPARELVQLAESDWLDELRSRRRRFLVQQDDRPLWHFRVYFDDAACLDVAADEVIDEGEVLPT